MKFTRDATLDALLRFASNVRVRLERAIEVERPVLDADSTIAARSGELIDAGRFQVASRCGGVDARTVERSSGAAGPATAGPAQSSARDAASRRRLQPTAPRASHLRITCYTASY